MVVFLFLDCGEVVLRKGTWLRRTYLVWILCKIEKQGILFCFLLLFCCCYCCCFFRKAIHTHFGENAEKKTPDIQVNEWITQRPTHLPMRTENDLCEFPHVYWTLHTPSILLLAPRPRVGGCGEGRTGQASLLTSASEFSLCSRQEVDVRVSEHMFCCAEDVDVKKRSWTRKPNPSLVLAPLFTC